MTNDVDVLMTLQQLVCCTRDSLYNLVHKEGGRPMDDGIGQPEYRRVMGDLRKQIGSGQLAVGGPIPSTASLGQQYGVSSTVIRRAVAELQAEGLLQGQPGKGVFVKAQPAEVVNEQQVIERLASGLANVQAQVSDLQSASPDTLEEVRQELADLRRIVGVLQTQLIDLYGRVGQPYPRESAPLWESGRQGDTRRAAGA